MSDGYKVPVGPSLLLAPSTPTKRQSVRRLEDEDDVLSFLPQGTTISEDQIDDLLKELEKPLQRTPRRTYVPWSERQKQLAPSPSPTKTMAPLATNRRSDADARYDSSERTSKNLATEAARSIGVSSAASQAAPRVKLNAKPLHQVLAERRATMAKSEQQRQNDELFTSLGLYDVKISDKEADAFLEHGTIPTSLTSQPKRRVDASAKDMARGSMPHACEGDGPTTTQLQALQSQLHVDQKAANDGEQPEATKAETSHSGIEEANVSNEHGAMSAEVERSPSSPDNASDSQFPEPETAEPAVSKKIQDENTSSRTDKTSACVAPLAETPPAHADAEAESSEMYDDERELLEAEQTSTVDADAQQQDAEEPQTAQDLESSSEKVITEKENTGDSVPREEEIPTEDHDMGDHHKDVAQSPKGQIAPDQPASATTNKNNEVQGTEKDVESLSREHATDATPRTSAPASDVSSASPQASVDQDTEDQELELEQVATHHQVGYGAETPGNVSFSEEKHSVLAETHAPEKENRDTEVTSVEKVIGIAVNENEMDQDVTPISENRCKLADEATETSAAVSNKGMSPVEEEEVPETKDSDAIVNGAQDSHAVSALEHETTVLPEVPSQEALTKSDDGIFNTASTLPEEETEERDSEPKDQHSSSDLEKEVQPVSPASNVGNADLSGAAEATHCGTDVSSIDAEQGASKSASHVDRANDMAADHAYTLTNDDVSSAQDRCQVNQSSTDSEMETTQAPGSESPGPDSSNIETLSSKSAIQTLQQTETTQGSNVCLNEDGDQVSVIAETPAADVPSNTSVSSSLSDYSEDLSGEDDSHEAPAEERDEKNLHRPATSTTSVEEQQPSTDRRHSEVSSESTNAKTAILETAGQYPTPVMSTVPSFPTANDEHVSQAPTHREHSEIPVFENKSSSLENDNAKPESRRRSMLDTIPNDQERAAHQRDAQTSESPALGRLEDKNVSFDMAAVDSVSAAKTDGAVASLDTEKDTLRTTTLRDDIEGMHQSALTEEKGDDAVAAEYDNVAPVEQLVPRLNIETELMEGHSDARNDDQPIPPRGSSDHSDILGHATSHLSENNDISNTGSSSHDVTAEGYQLPPSSKAAQDQTTDESMRDASTPGMGVLNMPEGVTELGTSSMRPSEPPADGASAQIPTPDKEASERKPMKLLHQAEDESSAASTDVVKDGETVHQRRGTSPSDTPHRVLLTPEAPHCNLAASVPQGARKKPLGPRPYDRNPSAAATPVITEETPAAEPVVDDTADDDTGLQSHTESAKLGTAEGASSHMCDDQKLDVSPEEAGKNTE